MNLPYSALWPVPKTYPRSPNLVLFHISRRPSSIPSGHRQRNPVILLGILRYCSPPAAGEPSTPGTGSVPPRKAPGEPLPWLAMCSTCCPLCRPPFFHNSSLLSSYTWNENEQQDRGRWEGAQKESCCRVTRPWSLLGAGGQSCPCQPQHQPPTLLQLQNHLFQALCCFNVISQCRGTRRVVLKLLYIAIRG